MQKMLTSEVSELRHFLYRVNSFLERKDIMQFINMNRVFRYHFFTTCSDLTETINLFAKDDFEHRKESHLRWIANVDTAIDLVELDINWRRLYTLANLKWFTDFMWLVLKRSKNLQILKLDFRLLPPKSYDACLGWTIGLLETINKPTLFEIILKGDKELSEDLVSLLLTFPNLSSLGLSTAFEQNVSLFSSNFPSLSRIEIIWAMDQVEPLNFYKFLSNHSKQLKSVTFSSCAQYNIRKLLLPIRKARKYIFKDINEQRGKYALTDLLRERTTHIRSLTFQNSAVWEREFARFDICVLPKLKKLRIESCKGFTTIDSLLKPTNCPQLKEVYIDNLKWFEPELIEGIFMGGYDVRRLTLVFFNTDAAEVFNRGLERVIAKVVRKWARFLPLPMWIFMALERLEVSDLDEIGLGLLQKIMEVGKGVYNKFKVYEARSHRRLL
jgi:hypothetical protein